MKLFHSPDYTASFHEFDTTRKAGWVAGSLSVDPIAGVELVAPRSELASTALDSVHDRRYVEAVRTGEPIHLAESSGFKWGPRTWDAVCASTAGVVQAALEAARSGGVTPGGPSRRKPTGTRILHTEGRHVSTEARCRGIPRVGRRRDRGVSGSRRRQQVMRRG